MTAAPGTELPRAGERHRRPLAIAFIMVLGFMGVEIATAFATGSLVILSDAGHMAGDALGLGMALAAITAASRTDAEGHHTFGLYRLEILAALANAVLLLGVAVYVLFEAATRFSNPPEIASTPLLVVGGIGLLVNIVAWRLLRRGAAESLNVEGAMLEVLADLFGSIGVIVAGALQRFTGWDGADPFFAAAIGLFILPRAYRLGRQALRVLVQAAPDRLDLAALRRELSAIPGVTDVHDLHVWTLTSEMDVASAHLVTAPGTPPHPVLDAARAVIQGEHGVAHATLQVEPDDHHGCEEVAW